MNISKRFLSMFLVLCMFIGLMPMTALAADNNYGVEETAAGEDFYRILHLDCGRKYFTKDWIIALINEMAAAGFNQLQLAFGNDGLRFLLDDMSVTVNGTTYSDENVTAGVKAGNLNYNNTVSYNPTVNELTQAEMDVIIAHANMKGIEIIPHLNMPGHMDAVLDAIEYVGISNVPFIGEKTSATSLNLNNSNAVAFAKALLQKYVDYFAARGCKYFHIGADEYGNDAYYNNRMGFPNMGSTLYGKFADFVNDCAAIVEGKNMTPRAWNDGISYGNENLHGSDIVYYDNFDTGIQITYWSSGWGTGYAPASPAYLRRNGHDMINTHGDYYYILGKGDSWDTNGYTYANNWNNSSFYGGNVSDPVGSMFCIWCDYPNAETETEIAENTRLILRAMSAKMQNNDASSISSDVVSGGFNADGTIAEDSSKVTVKDETADVEVTGYNLTSVTAVKAEAPAIAEAAAVKAWDITPKIGTAEYTYYATVKLPVPSDWTPSLVRGFYVENGEVKLASGTYADDFYSFTMPHFSVGGIMLLDAATVYSQLIELNEGESKTVLIEDVDLTGQTFTPDPAGIASVSTEVYTVEGNKTLVPVESMSDIVSGAKYLITTPYGQILTANSGAYNGNNNLLALEKGSIDVNNANVWTITSSGTGYTVSSGANSYLTFDTNMASVGSTATNISINYNYYGFTFQTNGDYLNNFGGAGQAAGGWYEYDNNADWYLYRIEGSDAAGGTKVTFTGDDAGETFVTVNGEVYKIIVHGMVPITIKYQTNDGTVIKTETVSVADNTTTYSVSNFNHNGKFYTVESTTLNITPATVTEYTVTVTEVEEDLSQVADLTIEYWQTNAQAEEQRGGNVTSKTVTAQSAYSENGIDLGTIIPLNTYKVGGAASDPALSYWRSRLLLKSTNEQTGADGDDETLNGTGFTKVRYWNGTWAVYTDAGVWNDVNTADYQLVAYYMNNMNLADEVSVSTSDWGKKGNGDYGSQYLGASNVSLAFQVIYEDGTTAPVGTGTELAPYTYFVDAWGNRGVGTVAINQIGDYQIWKITAETGEHNITHNGNYSSITLHGFTWDNNEMTVWEDAENPISHYTILNPSNNPNTDGYYDNLRWNEVSESILIRIYIKAVETEDSLKVVYYDEKFGDTLVEYNVSVPKNSNFNNGIVIAGTKTPATLPAFGTNANRKDATGYGIINALDKTQNFRTDLTQVPEAVGKYNNGLYTYTGSEISADGITITHYYTINTNTLSPNFVADFGLPLSFPLSQVVGKGQVDLVENVTVNEKTRYGTLTYNESTQTFTYKPTEVLQNIDVLSINIKFDTETTATLTNVGVTPATTVYYNESFIKDFTGEWKVTGTSEMKPQATVILGESDNNNFGYDSAYDNQTGASNGTSISAKTIGDNCTFTFTGTGIQVFANCTEETGRVAVTVKNSAGKIVSMSFVDTVVNYGDTNATTGQTGDMYGLPIVSLIDLTNMLHDQYTVTITKILDAEEPVSIDGIRVFGTIEDSSIFADDLEDNPDFYEMRDMVLNAFDTSNSIDEDREQVYKDIADALDGDVAIITGSIEKLYPTTDPEQAPAPTLQDLLDNGPKNELFLYPGQTLTFKVTTERVAQIGLKAPNGAVNANITTKTGEETTVTNKNLSINSSVDMFYDLIEKAAENTYTVSITNSGSQNILSVTLLKICDDPNAAFVPLDAEDIAGILSVEVDEDIEDKEPEEDVKEEEPEEDEKVEIDFENDEWFWDMLNLVNSKFAIIAEAYEGGSISKEGVTYVKYYNRITYTITPDEGYEVESVIVDGEDVGAVRRYTFRQVKDDHTISVKFKAIDEAAE